MEIPGLDRSDTPEQSWSNDDYSHYFDKVFTKIGIQNPTVVGQSFGGGVVASYANLYPEKLKQLVLVDPNTTDKNTFYPITVRLLGNVFFKTLRSSWIPENVKSLFVQLMLSVPQDQVKNTLFITRSVMGQTFIKTHTENQLKKLELITVPTLLIWGESDTKVPLTQIKSMEQSLKNEKLRTLPGGHTVVYRNPDAVAKIIKEEVVQ